MLFQKKKLKNWLVYPSGPGLLSLFMFFKKSKMFVFVIGPSKFSDSSLFSLGNILKSFSFSYIFSVSIMSYPV